MKKSPHIWIWNQDKNNSITTNAPIVAFPVRVLGQPSFMIGPQVQAIFNEPIFA